MEKSNNGLSKLDVATRDQFLKELDSLLNRYNIDGICNVPDFILAEVLLDTIYSVEKLQDNLSWWRGDKEHESELEVRVR